MQILKVDGGRGFYKLPAETEWTPIDQIGKDGLLGLLNALLENDVEMDQPDSTKLTHQAHLIIYRSIFEKLEKMLTDKTKFIDERDRLYLDEIQKYSQD